MSEKLRWMTAFHLNKMSRFCWADLVSWAQGVREFPTSRSCQIEGSKPKGCCYCGKFKDEAEGVQQ